MRRLLRACCAFVALLPPLAQPSQGCAAGSGATRLPGCAAIRQRTKTAVLRRGCARLAALRAAAPPASAATECRLCRALSPACTRRSPASDSAPAQTTACSCTRLAMLKFARQRFCAARCWAASPMGGILGWCCTRRAAALRAARRLLRRILVSCARPPACACNGGVRSALRGCSSDRAYAAWLLRAQSGSFARRPTADVKDVSAPRALPRARA